MAHAAQRILTWGLVACLLLLSGLVYAQTVEHTVHHAHHQAATHGSVLCSWLCAAGQGLEGVTIVLQACLGLLALAVLSLSHKPITLPLFFFETRGPPCFSS
ncbi:MAG TPA: hypothetical protein VGQ60_02145 [Nitrospiraceae bacterium]|jgi:hypothetical protein|nr:hypothetical protein [Nitrospiraceae bacterium]